MYERSDTYTMAEAKEMLANLLHLAATDPEFRQLCLNDSRAAVKKGMGIEFPDEVVVVFVERRSDGPGIVLPPLQTETAEQPPVVPPAPAAPPRPRGLNIKAKPPSDN